MSPFRSRLNTAAAVAGAVAGLLSLSACSPAASAPLSTPEPEAVWNAQLVPGPNKPEDLLQLRSGIVVVSGMSADPGGDSGGAGSLYSMDPETERLSPLWPGTDNSVDHDKTRFPECPGPPDSSVASPHGLGSKIDSAGTELLYVVNHGGREAIEVFKVGGSAQKPELTWVGCSVLPAGSFGNGVAPDPLTDGFYVTHFLDPADMPGGFKRAFAGEPTGHVLRWNVEAGWEKVDGSEISAPNGIAVSPDGKSIYVASWGSKKVLEIDANSGEHLRAASLDLMPDNLRFTSEGTLLITGQVIDSLETFNEYFSGKRKPDERYDIYELNPAGFTIERIAHGKQSGFGNPTTAIQVPGGMLVGSVSGTKILKLDRE